MDGRSASDIDATERFVFLQLHLSRSSLFAPARRVRHRGGGEEAVLLINNTSN